MIAPGAKELGESEHFRLYTVASSSGESGKPLIEICVKRCFYIDAVSGERYPGVASNYLCDRRLGDPIVITGRTGCRSSFRTTKTPISS